MPAWVVCACGHDVWCLLHQQHAMECPCPDYEEWHPFNPYLPLFVIEADG
jgi:hypothetical protein